MQPYKLYVNGWIYMEIRKVTPGIKQAGKIAHDWLKNQLTKFNYFPYQCTPYLCIHKNRKISFTLVVDYFGLKYSKNQHSKHLINALQKK